MSQKLFTLDEANATVPFLASVMPRLKALRTEIAGLMARVGSEGLELPKFLSLTDLPPEVEQIRTAVRTRADEFDAILSEIHERGVVVKDIDQGLADFFCDLGGEIVFLCWKMGEPEVRFWHGVDEGFSGRKNLFERRYLEQVTKVH